MDDLTNKKYGRLLVKRFISYSDKGHCSIWECICDCGKKVNVRSTNLKTGHTKSCGCYQEENKGKHSIIHGASNTPAFHVWKTIIQRCTNKNHQKYKYYGGRGIGICERWETFNNFLTDMGQPNGMVIDRIDNDKGYSPDNCRWVTRLESARNKKNNHIVSFNGSDMPISKLAETTGINSSALYRRINYWGMNGDEAVLNAMNRRKRKYYGQKVTLHANITN